jgi:hypothetical protein
MNQKEPKPVINRNDQNNNNQNFSKNDQIFKASNTYHVTLNGDKRIITASNLDDIIQNVREKYNLGKSNQIRINYWSDEYQEWIFLDVFPPEKTKLQVVLMDQM